MTLEVAKLDAAIQGEMSRVRAVVDLPDLLQSAETLSIVDDSTYGFAGEMVKHLRVVTKKADDERKKITGPLNESLKTVNAMYKTLVDPFERAEGTLRANMGKYAAVKRAREEEESRKQQEVLLRAAEQAEREKKPALASAALNLAVKAEEHKPAPVRTETATASSRKIYAGFHVTDFAAVPDQFKMVNEQAVRAAYAVGGRSIPGLVIEERESVTVR